MIRCQVQLHKGTARSSGTHSFTHIHDTCEIRFPAATARWPLCAADFDVADVTSFDAAMKKAAAGDVIVLQSGEWKDVDLRVRGQGEEGKPITVRAAEAGQSEAHGEFTPALWRRASGRRGTVVPELLPGKSGHRFLSRGFEETREPLRAARLRDHAGRGLHRCHGAQVGVALWPGECRGALPLRRQDQQGHPAGSLAARGGRGLTAEASH